MIQIAQKNSLRGPFPEESDNCQVAYPSLPNLFVSTDIPCQGSPVECTGLVVSGYNCLQSLPKEIEVTTTAPPIELLEPPPLMTIGNDPKLSPQDEEQPTDYDKLLSPPPPQYYPTSYQHEPASAYPSQYPSHQPTPYNESTNLGNPRGVLVDLLSPVPGLTAGSNIDPSVLQYAQTIPYSQQTMLNDRGRLNQTRDYVLGLFGPIGLTLLVIGIYKIVETVRAPPFSSVHPAPFFIMTFFGAILTLAYTCTWVCSLPGLCCKPEQFLCPTQMCLKGRYFNAANTHSDFSTLSQAIDQVSQDVPRVIFHVRCSHTRTTGFGDDEKTETVTTYEEQVCLPILHYRFVGAEQHQFCSTLDENHSGEVVIQFLPDIITLPEQQNTLSTFKQVLYEMNKHRDHMTNVALGVICGTFSNNNQFTQPSLFEGVPDKTTLGTDDQSIYMARTTSLGRRVEVYSANGQNSKLTCLTSPFVWIVGVLACLATPLACLWSLRFKSAVYHATFHVIFADVDGVVMAYREGHGNSMRPAVSPIITRKVQVNQPHHV